MDDSFNYRLACTHVPQCTLNPSIMHLPTASTTARTNSGHPPTSPDCRQPGANETLQTQISSGSQRAGYRFLPSIQAPFQRRRLAGHGLSSRHRRRRHQPQAVLGGDVTHGRSPTTMARIDHLHRDGHSAIRTVTAIRSRTGLLSHPLVESSLAILARRSGSL